MYERSGAVWVDVGVDNVCYCIEHAFQFACVQLFVVAKAQPQVLRSPRGKRKGRRGKRKLSVDYQQEEEEEEGEGSVEAMEMTSAGPKLSSADTERVNARLKGLLQVSQCPVETVYTRVLK